MSVEHTGTLRLPEYGSITGLEPSEDEPWNPAPEWCECRAWPEQLKQ